MSLKSVKYHEYLLDKETVNDYYETIPLLIDREGITMAVQSKNQRFNLSRICAECAIDETTVAITPITPEELKEIYNDFVGAKSDFEEARAAILNILNKFLQGKVHSIRARVKNPDHLIGKIIRNVNEKPDKYAKISIENYNKIITDLIGIRIIILNKHDWREIHNSLLTIFPNMPERYIVRPSDIETNFDTYQVSDNKDEWKAQSYHAEKPVVYITTEDDRNEYIDEYLRIDTAKKHYRSIHYIIRYGKFYFEIQVRTLFEEGWLEFDHRVKYPSDRNNAKKQEYIEILSSLAIAADRLIAFYHENEDDFKKDKKKQKATTLSDTTGVSPPSCVTIQDKMKLKF